MYIFRNFFAIASPILLIPISVWAAPVHIETIVFAHTGTQLETTEWFEIPQEVIVVEEIVFEDVIDAETDDVSEEVPIPVQSKELTEIARILEEHPDYTLINYLSWVQEPVRKVHTVSVSLDVEHEDELAVSQYILTGEISVYEVHQILQMEVNAFYTPIPNADEETVFLPQPVTRYLKGAEYELSERRQVRIGELHYVDHPKFGVLFYMVRPE